MTTDDLRALWLRELDPATLRAAEALDGGAMDPRVARVLIFLREAVAQATERACRDLRALGVDDPAAKDMLMGRHHRRA